MGALREAACRGLPVIAQGGVDLGNARAALEAGASGIAVTGAILLADDPGRRARALREALDA
jgi:thiamine monophosphate synthase